MTKTTRKEMANLRFGRLLVIKQGASKGKQAYWVCICDCGKETTVEGYKLRVGHTRSCGCLAMENPITKQKPVEVRFWAKVDKTPGLGPKGDCWEWAGSKIKEGYGNFRGFEGKNTVAHRVSYKLNVDKDFNMAWDQCICHSCDNKSCVKPEHLFVGTRNENNQDKKLKGRGKKGWLPENETMSLPLMERIAKLFLTGLINEKQLSKAFDTSYARIRMIIEDYNSGTLSLKKAHSSKYKVLQK